MPLSTFALLLMTGDVDCVLDLDGDSVFLSGDCNVL